MEGITERSGFARRSPEAGQADLSVRSEPYFAGRRHRSDFTEDVARAFRGSGWHTRNVEDGNDMDDVAKAIRESRAEKRASLVASGATRTSATAVPISRTPSRRMETARRRRITSHEEGPWLAHDGQFDLLQDSVAYFRQAIPPRRSSFEGGGTRSSTGYKKDFPTEAAEFEQIVSGAVPENWSADLPQWKPTDKAMATRAAGGEVLNALARRIPISSADLPT